MKKTQEVIGLPVIEISSGDQMGSVAGVVVSPEQSKVECLLLDRTSWYGEMRALPFSAVQGIGEFAVTVVQGSDVFPVSAKAELVKILERNIQVVKSGVMTKSGKYIGTVLEFLLDDKTGKILGCEVVADDGANFVVPGEKVVTFGAKFLVIEDGYETYRLDELSGEVAAGSEAKPVSAGKAGNASPPQTAKGKGASGDPVEVFEARQRQYLAGKKATKKITGTGGLVIIEENEIITEETIEKALSMDKYIELTMNVAD